MLSNKKILIVGAGQMQVPLIKKSKEKGIYTIVVDYDKNAPGFVYADKKYIISTHDKEKILEISKENKIDAIVTSSDFPVRVVAYVAKKLQLKALSSETAEISTDKYLLRKNLLSSNLDYPKFKLVESIDDLNDINFFPAIIKPVDSSASRGVKKIETLSELKKEFHNSIKYSNSKKLIVEEFIEGREFSIESATFDNKTNIIAITEKQLIGKSKGYFVEFSHTIPANITETEKLLIENTTKELIKNIKLNNSVSHTEIILSNKKAYIVEIGARLGGDYIASDLVPLSTGVDMLDIVIDGALNQEIKIKQNHNKFSAIQFVTPNNYNFIKNYIDKNSENIIKYELSEYKAVDIKNSLDRLGYVIFVAETKNKLVNIFNILNNEN